MIVRDSQWERAKNVGIVDLEGASDSLPKTSTLRFRHLEETEETGATACSCKADEECYERFIQLSLIVSSRYLQVVSALNSQSLSPLLGERVEPSGTYSVSVSSEVKRRNS